MKIELNISYQPVGKRFIESVRKQLLELSKMSGEISQAEVTFREEPGVDVIENKVCEIRLTIYGDDLMASAHTESVRKSAAIVLKELKHLVAQQASKRAEPPDVVVSTVNVR